MGSDLAHVAAPLELSLEREQMVPPHSLQLILF